MERIEPRDVRHDGLDVAVLPGTLLDGFACPVALIDKDGRILHVNRRWREYGAANGYTHSNFGVGENYLSICERASGACSEQAADAARGIRRVLSGAAREFELQYPGHSVQPQQWYKLIVGPLIQCGVIRGAILQHVEITREKLDELAMRDARVVAEQDNLAKSQFLAVASHELRTPLTAILGFSEIMMAHASLSLPGGHDREYLEAIHESGRHLLSIVANLMDLSRAEIGQYELDLQELAPLDILQTAYRLHAEHAGEAGIVLQVEAPSTVSGFSADRRAVLQCVTNLLSNALKFTPAGGSVTLSVQDTDDRVRFIVSDTGIGISKSDLTRILRPFEQGPDPFVRSRGGIGLGLSMVKELVKLHGGTLELNSAPGQGTVAAIEFARTPVDVGYPSESGEAPTQPRGFNQPRLEGAPIHHEPARVSAG